MRPVLSWTIPPLVAAALAGCAVGPDYVANAVASWELDVFGGSRREQEAARAEYEAAQTAVAATRLAIAAQAADTYMLVRGLQARLAIAREQMETAARLVDLVRLQQQQ